MKHSIAQIYRAALAFFCVVTVSAQAQNAPAEPAPPANMQLFLLIGQSNMAGRGKLEPIDRVTNPRIWMLTKDLKWTLAKDPVHFDRPMAGVGLASEFARTLAKADPNINIGFIPCAVGGTRLDQWEPTGELYQTALTRTREAMKNGKLAGILWHQGESDVNLLKARGKEPYPVRFAAMMAQLRQDLGDSNVPLVIGELGHYHPSFDNFNAMLPDMVKQVPHCALVSAADLPDKGDHLHFSSASLRTFGQRYAAAFLALQNPVSHP